MFPVVSGIDASEGGMYFHASEQLAGAVCRLRVGCGWVREQARGLSLI